MELKYPVLQMFPSMYILLIKGNFFLRWILVCHLRRATALKEDQRDKAKDYLEKAKDVIDTNPDLKLRAKQWEKLAENFN